MGSQSGGTTPLDLDGLKKLYGDDTVKELLQMSVDEARGLLDQLDDGIKGKDSKSVAAAAHQLKGLASTMTIEQMATLSFDVENQAKQEQWDAVADTACNLKSLFQSFENFVTDVLKE
jgi:HPt (histidine-containing phosphotransfer) domain-containing protein